MRRKYTVFEAPVNRSQLEIGPLPSSIPSVKTIMIAGLGNPGSEYDETRHNVGFMALDAIAHSFKVRRFNHNRLAHWAAVDLAFCEAPEPVRIVLVKPQTFMNTSGVAIAPMMKERNISLENLIVIHDEMDLPIGVIRVSFNATAAGHKGVRSIADNCGGKGFVRVRIGIDKPHSADGVIDHRPVKILQIRAGEHHRCHCQVAGRCPNHCLRWADDCAGHVQPQGGKGLMQSGSFDLLRQQAQASAPELFARFAQLPVQPGSITVSTPSSGYRQLLLTALVTDCPRPLVVVCSSIDRAEELSSMVRGLSGAVPDARPFVVLPELGVEIMEYTQYSRPLSFSRARALDQIYAHAETVVFTTIQGLIDPSIPSRDFAELVSALTVGDRIVPHSLARRLLDMGYEGVSSVTEMSQFSMRGNVFDLYSQVGEYPARIVLEGNVISRIKLFDPVTQQSVEPVPSVGILPPYPVVLDREARQSFAAMAAERWNKERTTREGTEEQDATFLEDLESFISTTNSRGVNYFLYQYADPERMCGGLAQVARTPCRRGVCRRRSRSRTDADLRLCAGTARPDYSSGLRAVVRRARPGGANCQTGSWPFHAGRFRSRLPQSRTP